MGIQLANEEQNIPAGKGERNIKEYRRPETSQYLYTDKDGLTYIVDYNANRPVKMRWALYEKDDYEELRAPVDVAPTRKELLKGWL